MGNEEELEEQGARGSQLRLHWSSDGETKLFWLSVLIFFLGLPEGLGLGVRVTFQLASPQEVWIEAGTSLPGQWLLSYSVTRNMEINFSQSQLELEIHPF